jgi:hypothetical protein
MLPHPEMVFSTLLLGIQPSAHKKTELKTTPKPKTQPNPKT